jgi:hypothetical protein
MSDPIDPTVPEPPAGVAIAGTEPWVTVIVQDIKEDLRNPQVLATILEGLLSALAPLIPGASVPLSIALQIIPRVAAVLPNPTGGTP